MTSETDQATEVMEPWRVELLAKQARRREVLARWDTPVAEWPLEWVTDHLRGTYGPVEVPPCRVCGRALSIASMGSGEATKYACSGREPDPDRPGETRWTEGRTPADEHYGQSQWRDNRNGGDEVVMELLRRYETATPTAEAQLRAALETARHALVTLGGLHAFDAASPAETFVIDDSATIELIDAALALSAATGSAT